MASDTFNFGTVDRAQAAAVGLPGQRTFRIQFLNGQGESASLWIEKEQLQALGSAIDQLIAQLSDDQLVDLATREQPLSEPRPELVFPEPYTVEFKIGRLALGFDEGRGLFSLLINEVETEDQDPADGGSLRCLVTRDQLQGLSEEIVEVATSGRPRCPLCGSVLTEGIAHFCPPSNGHARVQVEES